MRRGSRAAALAVLPALAGCGAEKEAERPDPFKKIDPRVAPAGDRAAPRWEPIASFTGAGAAVRSIDVSGRAIQWRARWRCSLGRLRLSVTPQPRSRPARSGGRCPTRGSASWIQNGSQRLRVDAIGRWSVVVEQQVDTPLREPPLEGMRSPRARVLGAGRFYEVERKGSGEARLYRLPNGRHTLRLERFNTSANTDLFVWLSESRRPGSTREALRAPHVELARLKSTLGSQSYVLPSSIESRRFRSVVIWCEPIRIVYTAAALRR